MCTNKFQQVILKDELSSDHLFVKYLIVSNNSKKIKDNTKNISLCYDESLVEIIFYVEKHLYFSGESKKQIPKYQIK